MNMECYVIGVYPPPYGGATVKCKLFCEMFRKNGGIVHEIDLYEINRNKIKIFSVLFKCVKAFCSKKEIVYCLDSKRLKTIMMLQRVFKKTFEKTTILVVGGIFDLTIKQSNFLKKNVKNVKGIWVETEGMKSKLTEMQIFNVKVFPNPKSEKGCCAPSKRKEKEPLKLVFFSQISKEKGVLDIIKLVQMLDKNNVNYQLDFYGHIVPNIRNEFQKMISNSQHVRYCGVFDSTNLDVYKKLNEYDILLFPTHWKGEGVPGILVEAKMAGIAVIASEKNFNAEIVREEKKEGFLIKEDYPKEMFNIISKCLQDEKELFDIKRSSYESRKRYAIEEYKNLLMLL